MIGQGAHRRYPLGGHPVGRSAIRDLGFAFEFFESELELFDLQRELLRRLAEGHASELGKLVPQGIDQRIAGRESGFALGDPGARKSVVEGKSVSVRVKPGGRRSNKKKN